MVFLIHIVTVILEKKVFAKGFFQSYFVTVDALALTNCIFITT